MRQAVLGVDMGTTSAKCVAFDVAGRPLGEGSAAYELRVPEPGAAEQDADEIWDAAVASIRRAVADAGLAPGEIHWVAFGGAMHSMLPVAADGSPAGPVLTYADTRSAPQMGRIEAATDMEMYSRTGTPLHAMSPLSKLVWMAEQRPHQFEQAARFVSPKEYVIHRLAGEWVVDHSLASATGLYDLRARDWDPEALEIASVTRSRLSTLVAATHSLPFSGTGASTLGVTENARLVVGAGDGCLANLGCGAVAPGIAAVTIGTSGAFRMGVAEPTTDRHGRTFCYVLDKDRWIAGGPISNGGLVLEWLRACLFGTAGDKVPSYDELLREAEEAPPGADGLLFAPFLAGERAPYWDSDARGVLFGLNLTHTRAHVIRSGVEGVCFALAAVADVLAEVVPAVVEIRATGGFTRSRGWLRILADVLGHEIAVPEVAEAACFGAALVALVAAGDVPSMDAAAGRVKIARRFAPDEEHRGAYRELRPIYDEIYGRLREQFRAIAGVQAQSIRAASSSKSTS